MGWRVKKPASGCETCVAKDLCWGENHDPFYSLGSTNGSGACLEFWRKMDEAQGPEGV